MYRFLENIIEIQGVQELKIAKIEGGEEPNRSRRNYRDYEARLKKMIEQYNKDFEDDELVRYVRSIATVLKFDLTVKKNKSVEKEEEEENENDEDLI